MGWLSSALDWCADKVQTVTGEKERRVLVEQFKEMYDDFKFMVKQKVEEINEKIKEFNSFIQKINLLRKNQIEPEIVRLGGFLGKFGNTKSIGAYAEEREKYEITLPEQQYEIIENYIFEIDWSQGEVFNNTFFLTPIGMTMKTKQQNLSMRERLNDFRLEIDETLSQLGIKKDEIEQNCRIAELYIFCVEFIADYMYTVDSEYLYKTGANLYDRYRFAPVFISLHSYQASGSSPAGLVTRGAGHPKSCGQYRPDALGFR